MARGQRAGGGQKATATGAVTAGVAGGLAGMAGASALAGGGFVPASLIYAATDLFGRVIPDIIKGEPPRAGVPTYQTEPGPGALLPQFTSWAQVDEYERRWGTPTIILTDGSKWDRIRGEMIDPPGTHFGDPSAVDPPPAPPDPVPDPEPEPIPPAPAAPDTNGGEPVSWVNTSLSAIGSFGSSVLGGVSSAIPQLAELAGATAPLWGSQAPVAAASMFGYQAPTTGAVPAGWVETADEGEVFQVANVPTTSLGGFQLAGGGIPGIDLMVPESRIIEPMTGGARTRMPASVTIPYTANGRQKYAYYKNMGRPVLYSGDFAACKRVHRIGSKAKRRGGR